MNAPQLVEQAIQMCAQDQFDELRQLVPFSVSADQSIKKVFISGFKHSGGTLLHVCAHFGSARCGSYLLRHGASPNVVDKKHRTPLIIAAWHGNLPIVISLLRSGADPNIPDDSTFTPLHKAAIRGHSEVIHHLIKEGADIHQIDYEGYTALHFAAKNGHYDSCEVLYRCGADPMRKNDLLSTPMEFASRYGFDDIVQLFNTPRGRLNVASSKATEPPRSVSSKRDSERTIQSASSKYFDDAMSTISTH